MSMCQCSGKHTYTQCEGLCISQILWGRMIYPHYVSAFLLLWLNTKACKMVLSTGRVWPKISARPHPKQLRAGYSETSLRSRLGAVKIPMLPGVFQSRPSAGEGIKFWAIPALSKHYARSREFFKAAWYNFHMCHHIALSNCNFLVQPYKQKELLFILVLFAPLFNFTCSVTLYLKVLNVCNCEEFNISLVSTTEDLYKLWNSLFLRNSQTASSSSCLHFKLIFSCFFGAFSCQQFFLPTYLLLKNLEGLFFLLSCSASGSCNLTVKNLKRKLERQNFLLLLVFLGFLACLDPHDSPDRKKNQNNFNILFFL